MGQDGAGILVWRLRVSMHHMYADQSTYRRYKTKPFAEQLLQILHSIRTPSWSEQHITPDLIGLQKVSGSMTNAVFFVSCPSVPRTRTLLLRIYGPSSGNLISRPRELHTLHVLSSKYHIGPRVYGTFENGRVEEYFDSTALTASDLRDPEISSWIGARMAELHGVDIDAVVWDAELADTPERGAQLTVFKNVKSWMASAREVLGLPGAPVEVRGSLDLDRFEREWDVYSQWLHQKEMSESASRRVFSHNDTQYGNLLRLRTLKPGLPSHRQVSRFFSTKPAKQFAKCSRFFSSRLMSRSRPKPLSHAYATRHRLRNPIVTATGHRRRFRVRVSKPCRV